MKKIIILSLLLFAGAIQAAEENLSGMKHGQSVHQNHCLKCHTDSIYTRENRVVKSINALGKQVRICRDNTQAPWFNDDTDAVINFLNKKYYKF